MALNKLQFKQWCAALAGNESEPRPLGSGTFANAPLIMGVLNITPDSFSDGGAYLKPDKAMVAVRHMIAMGADLIDIGGESSRPGADFVSLDEELARVMPIIEGIRRESDICLSIDTTKAAVMREALSAGVGLVNDISALADPEAVSIVRQFQANLCLMHCQGSPKTMQTSPSYPRGVVEEINDFFAERIAYCVAEGVSRDCLILDPGFGFGKTVVHNLQIIKAFKQFQQHQLPLLLGVSRKSTLGAVLNAPVADRLSAGLTLSVMAGMQGLAMIRTHDVKETKQAMMMMAAVKEV